MLNLRQGQLLLNKPHKGGQRAVYLHPARFQVVVCGRRWGKTALTKLLITQTIIRDGQEVIYVVPTYKMAKATWRDLRNVLGRLANRIDGSDMTMEFPNGASLTVWSATNADNMRGIAPALAIVDEAAMIQDADLWQSVIRPALSDHRGRAVFASTPRGRNWFWELYNRGHDPLFPDYKSWTFPTATNPYIHPGEIEEAQRTLPERVFRQEYLAEFLDSEGAVFRGVYDAATADYRDPYAGEFVAGVDFGRQNDMTVMVVVDANTNEMVDMDRFTDMRWDSQRTRLKAMYERWQPRVVVAEANSFGGPNIEALQDAGLPVEPFYTTATSKGPLIDGLALAIEQRDIALLNDRVLVNELLAYEMTQTRSGHYRFSAPDGGHDDTVIATALAWHALTVPRNIVQSLHNPFGMR